MLIGTDIAHLSIQSELVKYIRGQKIKDDSPMAIPHSNFQQGMVIDLPEDGLHLYAECALSWLKIPSD